MQCEDGRTTDAECVQTIDYLDNDYKFLSHRQRAYLRFLGYDGSFFISQDDCNFAIEKLKTINQNGVSGLDFNTLVTEETQKGDTFFNDAYDYVSKRGYDNLPRNLRRSGKPSLLITLIALPFRLLWLLCKGCLKLFGLAGKGAVIAGKGAVAAGQKGVELAKDAAGKAAEYEKENKVLQGAAAGLLATTKKGASMVADSLCMNEEQPTRLWTSADGKQTIEARLVGVSETAVRLQKPDGGLIDVPKLQLCQADLDLIDDK